MKERWNALLDLQGWMLDAPCPLYYVGRAEDYESAAREWEKGYEERRRHLEKLRARTAKRTSS